MELGIPDCFEQRPQSFALLEECGGIDSHQRTGKAGVTHVELGRFHQPAQSIVVPGGKPFQQKDAFQDRNVVVNGLSVELERRGKIRNVNESRCVIGRHRQKPGQCVE